jgi:creatinine amidohydrolase/Fe(II)-dependent formamide hydrolase-like protein
MREVRWERMFRDELEAALAACPVAYFAYGLCEPHGPQNAIGLDILKAHAICCAAARANGGIVAPPDFWHVHEHAGEAAWFAQVIGETRSWCTAVPAWHHFKSVAFHVRTAHQMGFHAALFVTGHYGPNWKDLNTLLAIYQPHVAPRLYGLPDFEANTPGFDHDGRSGGDHAGKVETSLLWAVLPECVDVSRIPPAGEPGTHWAMGPDARLANRRTGERMVEDEVRYLTGKAAELLADYDRAKPAHTLQTFGDVERLWAEVVRPAMDKFRTMKWDWHDHPLPPEDSRWYANAPMPPNPP